MSCRGAARPHGEAYLIRYCSDMISSESARCRTASDGPRVDRYRLRSALNEMGVRSGTLVQISQQAFWNDVCRRYPTLDGTTGLSTSNPCNAAGAATAPIRRRFSAALARPTTLGVSPWVGTTVPKAPPGRYLKLR